MQRTPIESHKKQSDSSLADAKEVDLDHYTCPLSKSLFFFPYQAPECGHVFEYDIIRARVAAGDKECPVSDCKCILDVGKIKVNLDDSKMFKEVNHMIERNPSLAAIRYFPIFMFIEILEQTTINSIQRILLRHLIQILEENSEILNKVDPKRGYSPLFILCNDLNNLEHGHSILEENPKIRGNITTEGLNAPCRVDHLKNLTPLLMLLRKKGLAILTRDRVLRQKIDPKTLILLGECKEHEGVFPLLNLTGGPPEGIQFLRDCPDLIDIIPPEALNMISPRGKYKGVSPVLTLVCHSDGLDLLSDFPQLRRKIRSSAFETISESKGYCEGVSPLFVLVATPKGRELLGSDEEFFVNMISSTGLNAICMMGSNKGTSPAYYLIVNLTGRELLRRFPRLRRMITLTTLCTAKQNNDSDNGNFPLLILASQGAGLLNLAKDLRQIITADALLQICQGGVNYGKSPYSVLKEHNVELLIKILKENIFLRHDLGSRISATDKQFFERMGVSFPSGRQLREDKQDSSTLSIIQNLKIDWSNAEHLGFWDSKTDKCWHGKGGIEVMHRGTSYRVPTRIYTMMEIAAEHGTYASTDLFATTLSQARASFWSNPFSWVTRDEITSQVYEKNSREITNFKV